MVNFEPLIKRLVVLNYKNSLTVRSVQVSTFHIKRLLVLNYKDLLAVRFGTGMFLIKRLVLLNYKDLLTNCQICSVK